MGDYAIEAATRQALDAFSPGESLKTLIRDLYGAGLPLNKHSNAYEAATAVKSGPGYLLGFTVYNSAVGAQFVQIHDSATVPADAAVPVFVISVAGATDREIYFGVPGRAFQRGIVLCNSSTGPTKTAGSADCFFDAQYI